MFDFSDCKNEQQFKMMYIKYILSKRHIRVFCIETEETVLGFPDVIGISFIEGKACTSFYEFKISDSKGKIKFKPTQPAFYKNNAELPVNVIACDRRSGKAVAFPVSKLFDENSPYRINLSGEVQL